MDLAAKNFIKHLIHHYTYNFLNMNILLIIIPIIE